MNLGAIAPGVFVAVGTLAALVTNASAPGGPEDAPTFDAAPAAVCPPAEPPAATGAPGAVAQESGTRVVIPFLAAGDAPAPVAPSEDMLALQVRLEDAIDDSGQPGRFAFAVTDLQTRASIGVNAERQQLGGCLLNLFVLLQAVRGAQAGDYALEDVSATVAQTIWSSDAVAAYKLYQFIGGGDALAGVTVVASLIEEMRLAGVVLDHPPAFPHVSLGVSENNWVTASGMNQAMSLLYDGGVLAEPYRSYLVDAMAVVKPGLNYLTAALPPEASVSHKNGFFWDFEGWVDNDTAIVQFESSGGRRAYAVTFLSEAVPVLYNDVPLGQKLVRMTWDYFRATYP